MDNKLPNNQNAQSPGSGIGQQTPPTPLSSPPVATVPSEPPGVGQSGPIPPSPVSTVVVPVNKGTKMPLWFYFLFVLVALVFLIITGLLAKTLLDRQKTTDVQKSPQVIAPSVIPEATAPTVIPTPEDEFINSMNKEGNSDEVNDIETDLEKTETTQLKGDLDLLDAEVNF